MQKLLKIRLNRLKKLETEHEAAEITVVVVVAPSVVVEAAEPLAQPRNPKAKTNLPFALRSFLLKTKT